MSDQPRVKRYGAYVQIPRELLLDAGAIEPTPQERAEAERQREESKRRQAGRDAVLAAARRSLAALTDPLSRAVLDLHRENGRGDCEGDDMDGYDAEYPSWPCRTVEAVAAHHGIALEAR